jgi:hypothetical protein
MNDDVIHEWFGSESKPQHHSDRIRRGNQRTEIRKARGGHAAVEKAWAQDIR